MRRFVPVLLLVLVLALAACSGTAESTPTSSQTSSVVLTGMVDVYDADTLMNAVRSSDTTGVNIKADITIGLSSIEEFEKQGFLMVIDQGVTVTMVDNFMPVYFGTDSINGIINNGTLVITGTFEFAMLTFENNGTMRIAADGMLAPCYSTIVNNGEVVIDDGGELRLERDTTFNNAATVTNNGILKISSDGGVFNNLETGTIVNNKTVVSVGTYTNAGQFIGEGEPMQ
ncbi:MAG TPA: hypothetical protein PK629_01365 [Oscillospiraceae bacterium]|nr:hypothetical protein [Oscillospiraceae bacterium]HPF56166.1 hypothetical protein [Clostridiales bacterium]HPK36055.1 hypothetical protein [Oscillospiraceae bacterium]HPR75986.1 hypothetical protein [Oscillospiraceae bacterium]